MNKKSIKFLGWALGLSMALAGVGVAVGASQKAPVETKAASGTSLTIASYASANSWEDKTAYTSIAYDSHITLTGKSNGNNSKFYTSNNSWRHYENDSGTITITATEATLTSVIFTYSAGSNGVLKYGDVEKTSGTKVNLSGTSAVFTVGRTSGDNKGNVQITSIKIEYDEVVVTKPLETDPVLKIGSATVTDLTASVAINKTLSLTVITDPSDTDEAIRVTTADSTKVSVSGASSPYTLRGEATTGASPIRITVAGSKGTHSSYIDITVTDAVQTVEDKVLDENVLGLVSTKYADNDKPHPFEAVDYITSNVMLQTSSMQFKGGLGTLYNNDAYTKDIKAITLIMNSGSASDGVMKVYGNGTTAGDITSSNEQESENTYAPRGINTYLFDEGVKYFTVKNESGTNKIDKIVIELVDSASADLGAARTAASTILDGLTGLCGAGGTGNVTSSQWSAIANNVGSLSDEAKSILKNAVRLPIAEMDLPSATIENAMYHYDNVIEKWGYSDILAISNVSLAAVPGAPANLTSNTNLPLIVTIVSLSTVAAAGLIFIRRKRLD